jgi:hypothetical protein
LCFTCSNHNSTVFLNNSLKTIYIRTQCDPSKEFPQLITIPYFEYASQLVPDCNTYPIHETAFALFIFYHQWLEYFEDNNMAVRGMLEKVMIQWGTKKRISKKGYDINGELYENHKIIGVVEADSIIWVWQGYYHRMSESALIHELVHIAIRAQQGDHGDPDHEGSKYRGWTKAHTRMIIETRQMLRAFEL